MKPSGSTISWTIPEATDVLSYDYLWSWEAEQGRDESSKNRPVVVVLALSKKGDLTEVVAVPVTTRQPKTGDHCVEIPQSVIRHLGLSAAKSWILTSEVNRFIWPGPDVRPIKGQSPYYGKIPALLLEKIRSDIQAQILNKKLKDVKRTP